MRNPLQQFSVIAGISLLAACGGSEPQPPAEEEREAATEATASADVAEAEAPTAEAPTAESASASETATLADFTPDVAHGEELFVQCQTCHVLEEGVNRIGPSLAGVIGRPAGAVEGFNYTPANADSGIVWTPEEMFRYLENPRAVIPGTNMIFVGFPDGQDRADLVAYLQASAAE